MRNRIALFLLLACTLIPVAGCGDDEPTGNSTPNGSVSAKVSGSNWSATNVQAVWTNNVLSIGGSQINGGNNNQINLTAMASGPGTFQVNPFAGVNATYTESTSTGGISVKIFSGSSGTITVERISSSGATGTFSFEAAEAQGGSGSRSITEGKFDVKF